jgi:superoxide dismutase, Cu-Zn family
MKARYIAGGSAALTAFFVLALVAKAQDNAMADLKNEKGENVGVVELTQTPHGVLFQVDLSGITPGTHAFHVHGMGKCEPPFKSAGDHFNPDGKKHGLLVADGAHAGDMPNLHVPDSGKLTVEILNVTVTLAKGPKNSLFQEGGTALIVHAGVDDYKTDPAGNAGDRIACGVVQ